jgi:hypothetical protein
MDKKITIANNNGRKLGYSLGWKEGYQFAYIELAEKLENLAKIYKRTARAYKPVHRACWFCASGLNKISKIKGQ